jgi:rhomboid family GlyGly-CTERM serine protease
VWRGFLQSSDWRFVAMMIPFMTLLQVIGPEYFRYQLDLIEQGQIWRLLSAHWVHVGWMHLLLNAIGLVICVSLTNPEWSPARWLLCCVIMAIGISLMLSVFNPELSDYAGLSGVLFGLYLQTALSLYSRDRLIAVLVIVAIVGKVLMEQFNFYDFNSGELIGARVIVDAHFYGLLMAIAIALVWARYTMNHSPNRQSE